MSDPPRHMMKSYVPDFNMISQHYRYKDTASHTISIQVPEYNTLVEDTCLGTDYKQCLVAKVKQVLVSTYLRKHNTYPCPPHHHPMMKKQSRHAHVDQVLIMIQLKLSMNRT